MCSGISARMRNRHNGEVVKEGNWVSRANYCGRRPGFSHISQSGTDLSRILWNLHGPYVLVATCNVE